MFERLLIYVLLLNTALSALYFLLCLLNICSKPAYMALLMLLLPVSGFFAILLINILYWKKLDGKRSINAERFTLEDKIYGRVQDPKELDVIPLGDALIIDDPQTRRAIMMEILHKDPERFTNELKRVLDIDDTEMIHYSVTTIVEMRTLFDDELARLENAYRADGGKTESTFAYARFIGRYLNSGILEGMRRDEIATRYSKVLRRAIQLAPDDPDWQLRYVTTERRGKRYVNAWEQLQGMMRRWPADERVWIAALECAISANDAALIRRLCTDSKKYSSNWPLSARQTFAFWKESANNEAHPA